MKRYEPKVLEPKWQQWWVDNNTYFADLDSKKPKYIGMSMFNYPSGSGIHIGHAMNYTISDVMARFMRQLGHESYHPVGWDSFGLPAENYAIKAGVSPQQSMAKIIPDYHTQYRAMGWSNDWSKEIATHEPEYYKWTQWIFSQMYRHGLAYQDSRMQWWCNKCQTVLANEQITAEGKCWRHEGKDDDVVAQREVKQWFFKITEYANELLEATDALDWTPAVKNMQKSWIGKSQGAEVVFKIADSDDLITVFTTRPDTLYGVTFLVLAPEHEMVQKIMSAEQKKEIVSYVKAASLKTEIERQSSKQKSGVFSGAYALNPVNDERIPIWIADYVLAGYGTGAIMAVPAHDERDKQFAGAYNLPIKQVVAEVFVDHANPHREDKVLVPRRVVTCIVKHPTEDKILIVKPKGGNNWSPLMGGIDEGESAVEAARREFIEESGYTDVKSISEVGMVIASEFFATHKDVNRIAYVQVVLLELSSLKQDLSLAVDAAEQELEWVTRQEYAVRQNDGGMKECLEIADGIDRDMVLEGRLIQSGEFDGLTTYEAREKIVADLSKKDLAREKTQFKLRDWSVSRQRYWGAPIPIVNCGVCGPVLLPDDQLPVVLPELEDFQPSGDGKSALGRAVEWLKVTCPQCGGMAERETDTLDTYICSSWYMLRYTDPHNTKEAFSGARANAWMPVDFYNGGDHATAHLLYARFVTRFFHKIGLVDNPEPFAKMLYNGKVVASDGAAFSKTLGNGPDPLEIIASGYGADALRTYLMFAAPVELGSRWDPQGVPGAYRFINRVWNLTHEYLDSKGTEESKGDKKVLMSTHKAIKKVTNDIREQAYNTAISAMMQCTNELYLLKVNGISKNAAWTFAVESLVQLIAPFAPHVAEELWHSLGHTDSVNKDHWPQWQEEFLAEDTITIAVQVNGKVRAEIQIDPNADEGSVIKAALADQKIQPYIVGDLKKAIYIKGRLVSLVV